MIIAMWYYCTGVSSYQFTVCLNFISIMMETDDFQIIVEFRGNRYDIDAAQSVALLY
jgi:hypothetical protein